MLYFFFYSVIIKSLYFYFYSIMNNNSVTKFNGLIEASYRLSLNEARIVFYGISLINPLSKEFPLEFKIDIKHFSDMFNIASNNAYTIIKQTAMDRFWEREFTFKTEKNKQMRVRWLTGIEYGNSQGYLKIFINPQLKPFLHQLVGGNFTRYYLENIANFKSVYSVRFYEIAIMELKRSKQLKWKFRLEIEDIKEKLDIKEKYKRFSNFKAIVLEPAKKEINKHSDINFNYNVIKLGRSPNEIEFTVSKKTKTPIIPYQNKPSKLTTVILEKAKEIVLKAGTGWDLYVIEQQFYEYTRKKGPPEKMEGAFLGFVKKKVANPP